jgi:hypothetical protein
VQLSKECASNPFWFVCRASPIGCCFGEEKTKKGNHLTTAYIHQQHIDSQSWNAEFTGIVQCWPSAFVSSWDLLYTEVAIKAHLELWSRADKMVAVVLACHSWDPNEAFGKFLMLMEHFTWVASAFWWRKTITAFLLLFLFRILCEYIPIFGYTKLYGIFRCLC